jgi:DHA1 family bicyclomycin/chloramphenicol resistance-like MFS transporter
MKPAAADSVPPPTHAGLGLMLLLIAMASIGPLSINIIVPAVPGLAASLEADPGTVQLTISLFFGGLACAQLVLGTLSDRYGRRPVLIAGFIIMVMTSFAAAAATSITTLIAARTTQALGASTGIVIGRAIIRDLYTRDRAASMLGWVTMSTVLLPMFGPLAGGVLDQWLGWRAIFIFVGFAGLLILTWAVLALPETRPPHAAGAMSAGQLWKEARTLLTTPVFLGFVLCCGMISGPYYAILGGVPHVVISQMGRSSTELGVWFLLSSFGYMLGNFLAGRFSVRFGVNAMVLWGLLIELVGAVLGLVLILGLPEPGPIAIFAPATLIYIGNGVALPNAIAGAVSVRPQAAGTASGVAGFVQMGYGAVVSQVINYPLAGATSAMPLVLAMLLQAVAGVLIFWLLVRRSSPAE